MLVRSAYAGIDLLMEGSCWNDNEICEVGISEFSLFEL